MEILIAEDDMISRNLLKTALRQFGHSVKAFSSGADAWAEYDANPYRVIVSDWLMPEMDGLDFAARCASVPRLNTPTSYC